MGTYLLCVSDTPPECVALVRVTQKILLVSQNGN